MSRPDKRWDVFVEDMAYAIKVDAPSATEARAQICERHRGKSLWPHLSNCTCGEVEAPCLLAGIERELRGTKLGKVCNL
jgi:hypothetical protein